MKKYSTIKNITDDGSFNFNEISKKIDKMILLFLLILIINWNFYKSENILT